MEDEKYKPGWFERECPNLVRQIEEASGLLTKAGGPPSEGHGAQAFSRIDICVGCRRAVALPTAHEYAWALCTDCGRSLSSQARAIVLAVGHAAYMAGCSSAQITVALGNRRICDLARSRATWRASAYLIAVAGVAVALAILTLWRLS
jgi:hypothetical protein